MLRVPEPFRGCDYCNLISNGATTEEEGRGHGSETAVEIFNITAASFNKDRRGEGGRMERCWDVINGRVVGEVGWGA